MFPTLAPSTLITFWASKDMANPQELISAFDRAKASFNNQADRSGYFDIYDPSLIAHGFPPNLPGNFEGIKMFYNALWGAFPDSHLEFEDMVIQGDKVALRFTFSGTQKGDLMGIPPTGKHVSIQGMRFFNFKGTKSVETWNVVDMLSMMQQLEVIKT
jgi:predicted ester cyclase